MSSCCVVVQEGDFWKMFLEKLFAMSCLLAPYGFDHSTKPLLNQHVSWNTVFLQQRTNISTLSPRKRYATKLLRDRRTQLPDPVEDEAAARRQTTGLYWKFYGILLLCIYGIYFSVSHFHHILVLVGQLYWIPQIMHDVRYGYRNSLGLKFVRSISVVRLVPVLYMYGCWVNIYDGDTQPKLSGDLTQLALSDGGLLSWVGRGGSGSSGGTWFGSAEDEGVISPDTESAENLGRAFGSLFSYFSSFTEDTVEKVTPSAGVLALISKRSSWNPWVCFFAILLQAVQVFLIHSQRRFGARWFVPWMCLPHVYNYAKSPPADAFDFIEDCEDEAEEEAPGSAKQDPPQVVGAAQQHQQSPDTPGTVEGEVLAETGDRSTTEEGGGPRRVVAGGPAPVGRVRRAAQKFR